MTRNEPTISELLRELADQYDTVVPERSVFDQVLARRPSRAKDPYASIREQLRYGATRVGWIWLGRGQLIPLRVALQGLRFRLILSDEERTQGSILLLYLRPFVPHDQIELQLQDVHGAAIPFEPDVIDLGKGLFGPLTLPSLNVSAWLEQHGYAADDSILVTITQLEPLTLQLEYEPASAFQAEAVAQQERELVDGLAQRVGRGGRDMVACEDCVLPIYAQAAWRTAYPGRPWRTLVAADARLRLIDGDYVADSAFRRPLDWLFAEERDEQYWANSDAQMLEVITSFQEELRASRREAVDRGLWNGIAPRISTARTMFDLREGTSETIYPGAVDVLSDHSADIEEHVARGDYHNEAWGDELEMDELIDFDDLEIDDELDDVDDIGDMQTFFAQNPELADATRQLMDSLSPHELERLQAAETLEDVQEVLSGRLHDLLRTNPSLFVPLELPPATGSNGNGHSNGNGNGNGNGHHIQNDLAAFEEWLEEDDEDEWDEEDENAIVGNQLKVSESLERSNSLMDQFHQHLLRQGKSESTAANRTHDLWVYADFLANYYGRALDEGDYATLDECLFFYYPRKVLNSTPRSAREICTSIKQFYAFLKADNPAISDAFAVAIWQRRNQVARVVELYDQLDSESPQFERLFAHLFAPYTA